MLLRLVQLHCRTSSTNYCFYTMISATPTATPPTPPPPPRLTATTTNTPPSTTATTTRRLLLTTTKTPTLPPFLFYRHPRHQRYPDFEAIFRSGLDMKELIYHGVSYDHQGRRAYLDARRRGLFWYRSCGFAGVRQFVEFMNLMFVRVFWEEVVAVARKWHSGACTSGQRS